MKIHAIRLLALCLLLGGCSIEVEPIVGNDASSADATHNGGDATVADASTADGGTPDVGQADAQLSSVDSGIAADATVADGSADVGTPPSEDSGLGRDASERDAGAQDGGQSAQDAGHDAGAPAPRHAVGGQVTGLSGTGLKLQDNGADTLDIKADGSFVFAATVAEGAGYAVSVFAQPGSPTQLCLVTRGKGTMGTADVTDVQVTCANAFKVSGNVTGLNGSGLILQDNGGDDLPIGADGSFTFATPVPGGFPYAVSVKQQPATQVCTVTNGAGTIGATDVTDVAVSCATGSFTIGGTVTGLSGGGLILQDNGKDDLTIAGDGPFVFTTSIQSGAAYAVTVLNDPSPSGQACVVTSGAGTVGGANVTDVQVSCGAVAQVASPVVLLPRSSISASELGVIVNDDDPLSVGVASYYMQARSIPAANLIHVKVPIVDQITSAQFAPIKAAVDAAAPAGIQAYAIAWTQPFRVEGMAVTSAFALGFDAKYYNTSGGACSGTASVAYYDTESLQPYTDFGIRPAMALAGTSLDNVKALIDHGVAADDTFPGGTGYFVRTTDPLRSVRYYDQQQTAADWAYEGGLVLDYIDNSAGKASDYITGKTDVLFYLTGLASVPSIATNTYLPGAVADHLTSYGGIIVGSSGQMSALRWLEAGATASFGTVEEPCNYTTKFPQASILVRDYFRGQTVLEAYWKSVQWPGEGIFVGEPLARPWGSAEVGMVGTTLVIRLTWLDPAKTYVLGAADSAAGPFTPVLSNLSVPHPRRATISLPNATRAYYKLAETGAL